MTENSGVLNKLMADNPNNKVDALEWVSASDDEKFSSASRIVQVRYRFYAVWTLLVVLLLLFWFLLPGRDTYQSKKSEIDSARRTLEALEARENKYKESIWFLETVQKEDAKIVSCINMWEACESLPKEIQNQSWLAKSFLLTNGMNKTKMDFDERTIIENIDSFLVKLEPFANNSSVNWEIVKISIWDKKSDWWLYSVPVQVDITFEDKSYLLAFINNVEKYVPEDDNIRILYKIDRISYDIINSDQPQDTSIYMNLYYYDEQ